MKGVALFFFFKQIAGTFGLLNPGDEFFCGFFPPIFPQPISWNGEKSSSIFFWGF